MSYSDPSTAAGLAYEDLKGRLLLITVHTVEEDVPTDYGKKNPVRADVAVLDGPDKGTEYNDTLIFPLVLIQQLKRYVGGGKVVARLGQGEPKPGQKPPWKLTAATDQEKETAAKFEEYKRSQTVATVEDEEEPF